MNNNNSNNSTRKSKRQRIETTRYVPPNEQDQHDVDKNKKQRRSQRQTRQRQTRSNQLVVAGTTTKSIKDKSSISNNNNNNNNNKVRRRNNKNKKSILLAAAAKRKRMNKNQNRTKPKVIVIGAGISGLACANELLNRNYDVLLIEARTRPGGRLKGIQLGTKNTSIINNNNNIYHPIYNNKNWIDLGGTLIHGINKNPIYTLVEHISQSKGENSYIQFVPKSSCMLINQTTTTETTNENDRRTETDKTTNDRTETDKTTTTTASATSTANSSNNNSNNNNNLIISTEQDDKVAKLFNECLDLTFQQTKSGKYNAVHNNTNHITNTNGNSNNSNNTNNNNTTIINTTTKKNDNNSNVIVTTIKGSEEKEKINDGEKIATAAATTTVAAAAAVMGNGDKSHDNNEDEKKDEEDDDGGDHNNNIQQQQHGKKKQIIENISTISSSSSSSNNSPTCIVKTKNEEEEERQENLVPDTKNPQEGQNRQEDDNGQQQIDNNNHTKTSHNINDDDEKIQGSNIDQQQDGTTTTTANTTTAKTSTKSTSTSSSNNSSNNNNNRPESFGDVFNKLYEEKYEKQLVSELEKCLFQWHKENLEVSCGTSLENLSYRWNDDEPYGFGGSHVALNTSWSYPIHMLTKNINNNNNSGLNILYGHKVTSINIIPPPTKQSPKSAEEEEDDEEEKQQEEVKVEEKSAAVATSSPSKTQSSPTTKKRNRESMTSTAITSNNNMKPTRISKRISERKSFPPPDIITSSTTTKATTTPSPHHRRRTTNKGSSSSSSPSSPIRRSGRSNKGVPERRLDISNVESLTYDNVVIPKRRVIQKKNKKNDNNKKTTTTATTTTTIRNGRGDDDEDEEDLDLLLEDKPKRPQATVQVTISPVNNDSNNSMSNNNQNNKNNSNSNNRHRKNKKRKKGRSKKNNSTTSNGASNNTSTTTITLQADSVICTLPLGILKLPPEHPNSVAFHPPLPMKKQNAINRLGCGLLNKCALLFPYVFWHQHNKHQDNNNNDDDGTDFLGVVGSNKKNYLMVNTPNPESPVLVFWFGGDFAKEIESWTDEEIVLDCMTTLRNSCNFTASNRNKKKFTTGITIPQPTDYAITRWGKEEFSRCAFTYIPPGVNEPHDELVAMSEPIYWKEEEEEEHNDDDDGKTKKEKEEDNDDDDYYDKPLRPSILFAGEHTTPYHPSTIHGAYLSGLREAYRLDFAMEPVLNWNYQFSMETLYKRTFAVKPKQPRNKQAITTTTSTATTAATAAAAGAGQANKKDGSSISKLSSTSIKNNSIGSISTSFTGSSSRNRKRKGEGLVGDMKLRKRPKQIQLYDNGNSRTSTGGGSSNVSQLNQPIPSRRSIRSTAGKRSINKNIVYDDNQTIKQQNDKNMGGVGGVDNDDYYYDKDVAKALLSSSQPTLSQPDVSLLRAVESYGINNQEGLDVIQNKIFPAYTEWTVSRKKKSSIMIQKDRQQQQQQNDDNGSNDNRTLSPPNVAGPAITVSQIKSRYKELLSLQQIESTKSLLTTPPLPSSSSKLNDSPNFLDEWKAPLLVKTAANINGHFASSSSSGKRNDKKNGHLTEKQRTRPVSGRKRVPKVILDL